MFRPTGLTLRAAPPKERDHLLDGAATPPLPRSIQSCPAGQRQNTQETAPSKTKDLSAQFLERGLRPCSTFGPHGPCLERVMYSNQSVFSLSVLELESAHPRIQTSAVSYTNNDGDLIRQRRIVERDGYAVVMRAHVKGVLAGERDINGCAGATAFGHG